MVGISCSDSSGSIAMYLIVIYYQKLKVMRNNQSSFKFGYICNHQKYLGTTKGTSISFQLRNELVYSTVRILDRRVNLTKKQLFQKIKLCRPLNREMQLFINHCATMIQKSFRGYQQRKYYKLFKPVLRRFKQLLYAIYMGWKVRRIMKTKQMSKKIGKIKQLVSKNQLRQSRIMKRELMEDICFLAEKGRWAQLKEIKEGKKEEKVKIRELISKFRENQREERKILSKKNTVNEQRKDKGGKQAKEDGQHVEEVRKANFEVEDRKPQKQISIKAKGFYQIPQSELNFEGNENKESLKTSKKGRINLKAKGKKQKGEEAKQKPITKVQNNDLKSRIEKDRTQIKEVPVIQEQKKTNGQEKKQAEEVVIVKPSALKERSISNVSALSIHLPIQEIHIDENKISRNERINTNSEQESLKTKKDKLNSEKKGIFLTISTQKKVNTETIPIKEKPVIKNNSNTQKQEIQQQRKESIKLKPDILYRQLKEDDRLFQIFNVYQTTYRKKKQQISYKLKQMRKMRKFLGDQAPGK